MKERILTKEEQILVLETQIKERALIVYVLESSILDNKASEYEWPESYIAALKDEISNHNTALEEYQEELNKLK